MSTVGHGAIEIRIHEEGREHRVLYLAKFADAVYVLHAFEKKTRKTSHQDLEIGRRRYRDLIRMRHL
jgi:phage-related protein